MTVGLLVLAGASPRAAVAQFAVGGVYIDSAGMLRNATELSDEQRMQLLRADAAAHGASTDVSRPSPLRKISLRRLEDSIAAAAAANRPLSADLLNLAGLQRVQYILFDPAERDVVLAGPAEGWRQSPTGEVVGAASGQPALQLDDLIVALRFAFAPEPRDPIVGCSIDPTPEGVARYAAYMKNLGAWDRRQLPQILAGMREAMGPQSVRVFGAPDSSRFAMKLVAADYRLKRIALAHDPSPVREVVNYLDLAAKRLRPGPQRQHRWWFVGEYEAIYRTPDELIFELEGSGVKVSTAPTVPGKQQQEKESAPAAEPKASPAALQFATSMSQHFEKAARHVPVFGELRNLVALTVASELIAQKARRNEEEHWRPTGLLSDDVYTLQETAVPRQVESLVNTRLVNNRHWLISISGGVELAPARIVDRTKIQEAPQVRKLEELPDRLRAPAESRNWWWD